MVTAMSYLSNMAASSRVFVMYTVAESLNQLNALGVALLLEDRCSGQLIPDSDLSFSSLATGGNPSFAACGRF